MKVSSKPRTRQAQQAHTLWERGVALTKEKQWQAAAEAFSAAAILQPRDAVLALNAARCHFQAGHLDEALRHAEQACVLDPDAELQALFRVRILNSLQRHAEAMKLLQGMPECTRNSFEYNSFMAFCLQHVGEHQKAVSAYMEALSLKMDDAMSHYRMGVSFYQLGLKEEASECFRTALVLGLGLGAVHVHGMLAYAERENARWPQAKLELDQLRDIIDQLPEDAAVTTAPFAHITLMDDPLHQLKAARLMANTWRSIQPLAPAPRRTGDGRIRVGYLSSDLYHHATCVLMAEMFEHHDRNRFEVFVYSHGPDDNSAMRRRVIEASEHFVELRGLADSEMAQRIAADGIDVLIDLKGYTANNRMGVLARHPAHVQAAFLGFPGTTGAGFMDYIVGDPVVTPLSHAHHFAEKIAQMPICYQPNDRQRPRPQPRTRAQVGLPEDALVLCAFNQAYKISAEVLDVWVDLLRALPEAVLWLLDWHGQARPNLEGELVARGVDLARVIWAPRQGLDEHINRVALADIFIDTWPCNAHTTASDALWAGLPVVTFMGRTFASRVAASLLSACGLGELISESVDTYKQTVLRLAGDPMLRASLRQRLVAARETSALFDSERFTRDFEDLLVRMVLRAKSGLTPDQLPAASSVRTSGMRDMGCEPSRL